MGWEMQHRCHVFHGLRRSSGATCPVCLEELGREPVPWERGTGGTGAGCWDGWILWNPPKSVRWIIHLGVNWMNLLSHLET